MKLFSSRSAFTLIEMIIAITIFSVFMTLVLVSYMRANSVFLDLADARSLNSEAAIFMQEVVNHLKTEPVTLEGDTVRFADGAYTWNSLEGTLMWEGEPVFSEAVKVHDFSVDFLSDGSDPKFPLLIGVTLDLGRPARSRPEVKIHLETALTPRYATPQP